ncbi:MAG: hypothetical protein HZC02_00265 [Candidatus Levybacteria bacterium]|nr:hypothetical protein [Candidatus Levybacteria bacterium]
MTENTFGKDNIIPFRPRSTDRPKPPVPSLPPRAGDLESLVSLLGHRDVAAIKPGFTIHDMDGLYDDSQLLMAGESLAEKLEALKEMEDQRKAAMLREQLEEDAFRARRDFISANVSGKGRELAYKDLFEHTFAVAGEFGDEELRLRLRGRAILLARDVFGDRTASKMIERAGLVAFANENPGSRNVVKNGSATDSPESGNPHSKILQFRSKK